MITRSRRLAVGATALMLGVASSASGPSPAAHAQDRGPAPVAVQAANFAESPALRDVAAAAVAIDRSEDAEEGEAAENREVRTLLPRTYRPCSGDSG